MSEAERRWVRVLMVALEESVKLQSHYAALLNMHDGGGRRQFAHATDWIARLLETKTIDTGEVCGIFAEMAKPREEAKR